MAGLVLYLCSSPNGSYVEMDRLELGIKPAVFLNCNSVYGQNFQVSEAKQQRFEDDYERWAS